MIKGARSKMAEISINEYVRSNLGSIGKVTRIEDSKFLYENKVLICFIDNVINHSKNIIDLIEERRLCEWKRNFKN